MKKIFVCLLMFIMINVHAEDKYPNDFKEKQLYQTNNYPLIGEANGEVTVVMFSDFQCEPCRAAFQALQRLSQQYANLRIIILNYPIIDDVSIFAAKVAVASKYMGRYFDFHHAIFATPEILSNTHIIEVSKTAGIDVAQLKQLMNSQAVIQDLLDEVLLGNAFHVNSTPAYVVGYTHAPHNTTAYIGISIKQLSKVIASFEQGL